MNTKVIEATEFEDAKIVWTTPSGGTVTIYASERHDGALLQIDYPRGVTDGLDVRINDRYIWRGCA